MDFVDQQWYPGAVRVRAKAVDPHEGLTGHAYIAARNLASNVARIEPTPGANFAFLTGAADFSPITDRHYLPATGEQA